MSISHQYDLVWRARMVAVLVVLLAAAAAGCGDESSVRYEDISGPKVAWYHGPMCLSMYVLDGENRRWAGSSCDGGLMLEPQGVEDGAYTRAVALFETLRDPSTYECPDGRIAHQFSEELADAKKTVWNQCVNGLAGVSNPDDFEEPFRSIAKLLLGP